MLKKQAFVRVTFSNPPWSHKLRPAYGLEKKMEKTEPNSAEEWVQAARVEGDIYADMAAEALQNAGIPCEVKKSMLSSGLGIHTVSLANNPATILVPRSLLEKAREIIEQILGSQQEGAAS